MSNLILPKKHKLDEVEEIVLPHVKCDACGKWTQTGLHQRQLIMVRPGGRVKVNGQWTIRPAVMKKVDKYMCTDCVKSGKKWPGSSPR